MELLCTALFHVLGERDVAPVVSDCINQYSYVVFASVSKHTFVHNLNSTMPPVVIFPTYNTTTWYLVYDRTGIWNKDFEDDAARSM